MAMAMIARPIRCRKQAASAHELQDCHDTSIDRQLTVSGQIVGLGFPSKKKRLPIDDGQLKFVDIII
jgi:hypothetical protein